MGDIVVLMDFYVVCGNEVALFVFLFGIFFRLLNGVWGFWGIFMLYLEMGLLCLCS